MAGHHAEHARQTATLRWVALGILIPNTFFVEAALGRFARCRYSAIQNNVQTNTYDPRRHGATPSLLSCRQSQTLAGALIPAVEMSGVVDSGRKSRHGNIDANDPNQALIEGGTRMRRLRLVCGRAIADASLRRTRGTLARSAASYTVSRSVEMLAIYGALAMLKLLVSRVVYLLAIVCLGPWSASTSAAQLAAGIEYSYIERPAGLPEDYGASAGTTLKFLSIKAIDGSFVQAALWHPDAKSPADTTLIVMVHGSGGNYARPPNSSLSRDLSARGFAALAINTRQHDDKRNTDNFFETSRDIDASVQTAKALGYHSIVLQGHSLGTLQVLFYAATNWDRDIKALVQLSTLGDLPWRSRYLQVQDEEKFRLLSEAAMKSLREYHEQDIMTLRMRRTATIEEPLTGEHFLTYRAGATAGADGPYWIRRVPRPILIVRGAGDTIVPQFEPYTLVSSATSPGSLVPSIKFVEVPDAKGPNPGGHFFVDNSKQLSETIASWLGEQHL